MYDAYYCSRGIGQILLHTPPIPQFIDGDIRQKQHKFLYFKIKFEKHLQSLNYLNSILRAIDKTSNGIEFDLQFYRILRQ